MWILESSSELFQGRRMWLKPGKSYLFGRVKKDGVRFAIDNKTISRKHFIIKIDDIDIEDVGNIHARSRITIEDQNSKAGTHVNNENIKGSTRELKNEENFIRPGNLPEELVIKWYPIMLTYNLLKKEIKSGVLKSKQERVKDLDIKAISDYVPGQTTHLVVNKRNTPKSLQALIDGRPLVAESFIDSLEYAATPSDLNEEENLSPLEQDFDSAWPESYDHLPPPGREPTLRPAESYKPDTGRRTVFENFTFVFLDQTQYDNLLPPITTGHGKVLLHKIVVHETTSDDLVTFLQNTAGYKGFGDTQKDDDNGGVILVRYKGDAGTEDWTNNLINETSLKLDQRAIDQGEFLDAILANDATLLRQAVPFESDPYGAVAPPATAASLSSIPQSSSDRPTTSNARSSEVNTSPLVTVPQRTKKHQHENNDEDSLPRHASGISQTVQVERQPSGSNDELEPSAKRARFMMPKKSRVLDFDDDFDPDKVIPYHEDDDSNVDVSQTQREMTPSQIDNDQEAVKAEPPSSRKRPRSPLQEASASFNDDMDDLLPAAAAMKRRRLAREGRNGVPATEIKKKPIPALLKKPKVEKDIDVREIARAERRAEEEKAKKEQEDLEEDFQMEPGQSLPVYDVETVIIDLPTRKQQSSEIDQSGSDRWDPQWNGRKNFKGFRRAKGNLNGEAGGEARRRNHTKVIVPLVEAKTSTYGMGDQYWDRTQEEKERDREKKKRASQRTTQSQSDQSRASRQQRSQTIHDSDSEDGQDAANGDSTHTSPELSRLQNEAAEITAHAIDVDEPRRTRASDTQAPLQVADASRGAKRPGNGVGRGGPAKKQKTLLVTTIHGSDSDDSDDMKFKFGSRQRGRGKT